MKFVSFLPLVLATLSLVPAARAADVYVVHGIDGSDLGLDPALLVDVEVNGAAALDDVAFGDVAGALPFETGFHDVAIRLSDGVPGAATGLVVTQTRLNLAAFETAVVVAHLDVNGTITLGKFTVNTDPIAAGSARVAVAHAAAAPAVDVQAKGTQGTKGTVRTKLISNGNQSPAFDVNEGTYLFRVKPALAKGIVADLPDVPVTGNLLIVAVGTLAKGTFTVIPVSIG